MKTVVMELWHSGDTLDGADYAALEVTHYMALEMLVLIARFHKIQSDEEKLSSIVYRDVYIPTFFKDFEGYGDLDGTFGEVVSGFHTWEDGVVILEERLEVPDEAERLLEYPKLWVQEDRVFWRGSYRHEDVIVETAPLMREVLQQIAKVKPC